VTVLLSGLFIAGNDNRLTRNVDQSDQTDNVNRFH